MLEVTYKDKNIDDVLNLTVTEAIEFFKEEPRVIAKMKNLEEVGLGYVRLGQSSSTLSGGEAQRIKLATFLNKQYDEGKTLYIFDEPTTGLHFDDIRKLLYAINKLVENGNSVLIIEHHLDVIKCADWIIDLGPEGGEEGGKLVFSGRPEELVQVKESYTGKFLKEKLKS